MAPSAVDGPVSAPAELPDEVNKPPEGVVLPPKDIRAIVEKTAGFVARNGHVFEDRVREKEKNNPKFSFLLPNDAYTPFYQWRLSEIKEGRGTAVSAGRAGEPTAEPEPEEEPKGPEAPPEFRFSARMPNISASDLEVVKLTALFVAKRGKSFMTALSQRETRNYQFDFLRPQHSLYQFFTRLVDQYTELLQSDGAEASAAQENRVAELKKNTKNKYHILDRAKQRAEWVKFQEQQKQKKEEEQEQEKLTYAQIDWHDFVVVETVMFTEADDQAELPPPTSLNDLQSASLEQKAMMSLQPQNRRIEEAMPTDEEGSAYYNAHPAPEAGPVQMPNYPQQPVPSHSPAPVSTPTPPIAASATAEEEERRIRERTEARDRAHAAQDAARAAPTPPPGQPPMRIRSDYVPRAQAKRLNTSNVPTTICPNCKQQIPVAEMEQHMRIELLDPRWKEQRAKAEERQSTTNLSTADVANNLKRLASQRSDVFDPVPGGGQQQQQQQQQQQYQQDLDPDEEARRKRQAMGIGPGMPVPGGADGAPGQGPEAPQGPGTLPPPPAMQNVDIEEQIRQIHQKFKQ